MNKEIDFFSTYFIRSFRFIGDKLSKRSFYPWLIWTLGATFFFSEYFAHVSQSVMVPQLMYAFHVGAGSIGALSAYFWWAYVAMQVPVGTLVDRYGPHLLLMLAALLCASGCILFAVATTIGVADVSRLLVGFGGSFAFIGTLKLAKIWFPPYRFGFLAGLTQAVGMFGAVVGQGPVAYGVATIGWRGTTWVMGIFILVLAVLIGLLVRDNPKRLTSDDQHVDSARDIVQGLKVVLQNPQTWINGLFVGLLFAPTQAFGELWGPEYFRSLYGFSQQFAGTATSLIFIGWAIGGPLAGRLSDHLHLRKPILIFSALASLITLLLILYVHVPLPILFILLFMYGVANTGVGVSYAVAGEINPSAVSGISMGFANMASVLIGAVCQPLIGNILELFQTSVTAAGVPVYSTLAYKMAAMVLPGCLLVSVVIAFFIKETHCVSHGELKKEVKADG